MRGTLVVHLHSLTKYNTSTEIRGWNLVPSYVCMYVCRLDVSFSLYKAISMSGYITTGVV